VTLSAADDRGPARHDLLILRGDDVSFLFELFTSKIGYRDDTVDTPLDITGRTYASSIVRTLGGSVVLTPTVTVTDAANGQITWSLTDAQTDTLSSGRYTYDIIENAGTTNERCIELAQITVSGRATP
jgi:hypothetical protein